MTISSGFKNPTWPAKGAYPYIAVFRQARETEDTPTLLVLGPGRDDKTLTAVSIPGGWYDNNWSKNLYRRADVGSLLVMEQMS